MMILNLNLVILLEYEHIKMFFCFAKCYAPNSSEEVFVIEKVKNTVSWTYFDNNINGEETVGIFYEKEMQKTKKSKSKSA